MKTSIKKSLDSLYHQFGSVCLNNVQVSDIHLNSQDSQGLSLLNLFEVLKKYDKQNILNNGIDWLKQTSLISLKECYQEKIPVVASELFSIILEQSSKLPEMSRDVSNNILPQVLDKILLKKNNYSSQLNCLVSIMENYPKCSTLKLKRGKICRFLLPLMLSKNNKIKKKAIKSWSLLPFVGGNVVKIFRQDWINQLNETLNSLEYIVKFIFENDQDTPDPFYGSLTLGFAPLTVDEPECSYSALQRYFTLCKCLISMFQVDAGKEPMAVEVDVNRILKLASFVLNVSRDELSSTTEMNIRKQSLEKMKESMLQIIKDFIKRFSSVLYRHSNHINLLLKNFVKLYQMEMVASKRLRAHYYDVIITWVTSLGGLSQFVRSDDVVMIDIIQSEFTKSLSLNQITSTSRISMTKKSSKKSKSINCDTSIADSSGDLYDEKLIFDLCIRSLKVTRHVIYTFADSMTTQMTDLLESSIINLFQQIFFKDPSTILYQKFSELRIELYHVLRALAVTSQSGIIQYAVSYFSLGSSLDDSHDVRSFCRECSVMMTSLCRANPIRSLSTESRSKIKEFEDRVLCLDASVQTDRINEGSVKDDEDFDLDESRMEEDEKSISLEEDETNMIVENTAELREDEDHLEEDKDHLEEDKDHLEEDKDHLEEDEDHLRKDEDHLEEDEDHLEEDEDHLSDDLDETGFSPSGEIEESPNKKAKIEEFYDEEVAAMLADFRDSGSDEGLE